MDINKIYQGNCIEVLKTFPDKSIDCCITSPPYYGLRDYGSGEQIGLEETPELYIEKLVQVFREVKRVLKDNATLWLNLGDSYWGGKGQSGSRGAEFQEQRNLSGESINKDYQTLGGAKQTRPTDGKHDVIKPKDLTGIPWMAAFALRADGWYLRQDIIWHKPNPMPESVTDRCTKSHEYIFLLSKSSKYYYDQEAIKEPMADSTLNDARMLDAEYKNRRVDRGYPGQPSNGSGMIKPKACSSEQSPDGKRNKRSVWTVTTKPYADAHFATFPETLITDCIKAGCPEQGIVLDPFMGAGTTALVARKLNRNFVGIELNPEYITIAERRLQKHLGLFI